MNGDIKFTANAGTSTFKSVLPLTRYVPSTVTLPLTAPLASSKASAIAKIEPTLAYVATSVGVPLILIFFGVRVKLFQSAPEFSTLLNALVITYCLAASALVEPTNKAFKTVLSAFHTEVTLVNKSVNVGTEIVTGATTFFNSFSPSTNFMFNT